MIVIDGGNDGGDNMHKILIVEDDETIRMGLKYFLENEHFEMMEASNIEEAKFKLDDQPDLILLDLGLPDGNGFDLFEMIRQHDHIPTIFLTAVDEEVSIVRGLDMGADDYVTKPFTTMELLARVNSHLRRYGRFLEMVDGKKQNEKVYTIGGLELNEETIEVFVDGSPVKLTPLEFKILLLLMKNPGRVFSAEEIYERVWNEQAINTDTIMVHIRKIREKIEVNSREPKYLKVVWGIGYKIEKQ